MKTCSKCGQEKSLTEFFRDKSIKSGYRAACKVCCVNSRKKYLKQYYQDNKEHLQALNRTWRKANPEKERAHSKARYQKNREHEIARVTAYRKNNRQKQNAYKKTWRFENQEKVAEYKAKRRSSCEDNFTAEQFKELCAYYSNRCIACKSLEKMTVDHVIPLSKGGLNSIENIQPLCLSCNASKGAKTVDYRLGDNSWLAQ